MIVTTCKKPPAAILQRAQAVARMCGLTHIPRSGRSLNRLRRETGASLLYLVGRAREEIMDGDRSLHIHPGRFFLKRKDGLTHPLIRAIAPPDGPPVTHMVDGTLGLAGDALHLSALLGLWIEGFEASPPIAALLQSGLARMAGEHRSWSPGAARIEVMVGDVTAHLSARRAGSVPVVYLDPMFDAPSGSTQDFDIFRRLAVGAPLSQEMLEAAVRAASQRVVVKIPGAAEAPDIEVPAPGWNRRVRGGAVDYLIVEKALSAPVYEVPDLGRRRRS